MKAVAIFSSFFSSLQYFRLMAGKTHRRSFSLQQFAMKRSETNFNGIDWFYNDIYEVPLPLNHRFPMEKYRIVRQSLQLEYLPLPTTTNGSSQRQQRGDEGPCVRFIPSPLATREELVTTHCADYVDRYCSGRNFSDAEIRKTGFPWSLQQVHRSLSSVGGTIAAMRNVMNKVASAPQEAGKTACLLSGHLAGGTHHAFRDYGEGFCIFNDIAVAANVALREYSDHIARILIIDCDVHQGNGNAKLFQQSSQVFTYSIHCEENIFSEKQYSTLDIAVEKGCEDERYLSLLRSSLDPLFEDIAPSLVFLQMGVDISEHDRLGKLKITRQGLRQRNLYLYQLLSRSRTPAVVTMGGGYPKNLNPSSVDFQNIVDLHADVYRQAIEVYCG